MGKNNNNNNSNRGLALANQETKERVNRVCGEASHGQRGLQVLDEETPNMQYKKTVRHGKIKKSFIIFVNS